MILCNYCGATIIEGKPRCDECKRASPFAAESKSLNQPPGGNVNPLNKVKENVESKPAPGVEERGLKVGVPQNGSPSAKNIQPAPSNIVKKSARAKPSTTPTPVAHNKFSALPVAIIICMVVIGVGVAAVMLVSRKETNKNGADDVIAPEKVLVPEDEMPPGMVRVSGGTFLMGRKDGDAYERPEHSVNVKPFFIDKYEVTREEYESFIKDAKHRAPPNWINNHYPEGTGQYPVTGVDWDDASAYAAWRDKRLPTEDEWEFAARGTEGFRYPWGNDWKQGAANADASSQKGLADVGKHTGVSPFGAFDMVGNAWEWTASKLSAYPGGRLPDQRPGDLRVIRGGSWQSDMKSATTTYRWGWPARDGTDYSNTSFRCVKNVSAPSSNN